MSIFDVEVDPKAIEAAAKDEPPPYIPTDLDEQGMCSGTKDENTAPTNAVATAAALAASQGAVSKLEKWKEIIEEDAEEEARAGMGSGKSTKAPKKVTIDEASLWPAAYRNDVRNESMHEDDMHFPEPSMDDFFHEQEDIDDHDIKEDSIEPQGTTPIASPLEVPKVSAAASSISLIPSKASAKSKKPKFRTKSRMRK